MGARIFFLGFLCCAAACLLSSGMVMDYSQEKTLKPETLPSLIRKELLQRESKSLNPPKRNIFTPQRAGYGLSSPDEVGISVVQPESGAAMGAKPPVKEAAYRIDIRYIGYIGSQERTVAIIIFNGEAMAVEKGEPISEEVKILEITPQSIEFFGPDYVPNKVFLEGEEQ